jgi:hypothetical protein
VECGYVPGGGLNGGDELTIFVYIYLVGASALPGPLSISMSASNGYSVRYTGAPSGTAAQVLQGPIYAADWGRTLTVRIAADPNDQYRETNEGNNAIVVSINLPATRLGKTVDPLPCSAQSAP